MSARKRQKWRMVQQPGQSQLSSGSLLAFVSPVLANHAVVGPDRCQHKDPFGEQAEVCTTVHGVELGRASCDNDVSRTNCRFEVMWPFLRIAA
eukprot:s4098_g16.t1